MNIYRIELETLWQKDKVLTMSNFFFCHNDFERHLLHIHEIAAASGKGLCVLLWSVASICILYYLKWNIKWRIQCIMSLLILSASLSIYSFVYVVKYTEWALLLALFHMTMLLLCIWNRCFWKYCSFWAADFL